MKRLRWTAVPVAAAVLLAGCGEITNTLTPPPGTANTVTVALDAPANFSQVGLYEADANGDLLQTDLKVRFIRPTDPIAALESGRAQIAISNEPKILLARNRHIALASVAAILQGPQRVVISCTNPNVKSGAKTPSASKRKAGSRSPTTSTASRSRTRIATTRQTTSVPRLHPPLHPARCRASTVARPDSRYADAPTYNGLNLVVTENEIINHAPVLRRFVQAVGRGYNAVRANPAAATANLVKLNPHLNEAVQLAGVRASLANFFPRGVAANRPWGWQQVPDWNAFGSWMLSHRLITNINATPDADTNELLAGQGV